MPQAPIRTVRIEPRIVPTRWRSLSERRKLVSGAPLTIIAMAVAIECAALNRV